MFCRVFDEDAVGKDDELGEIFIRVSDLDIDGGTCTFKTLSPSMTTHTESSRSKWSMVRKRSSSRPPRGGFFGLMSTLKSSTNKVAAAAADWQQHEGGGEGDSGGDSGASDGEDFLLAVEDQLYAHNSHILDKWHDLKPTPNMVAAAAKAGVAVVEDLGSIRVRTWIKNHDSVDAEVIGHDSDNDEEAEGDEEDDDEGEEGAVRNFSFVEQGIHSSSPGNTSPVSSPASSFVSSEPPHHQGNSR